MTATFAFLKKEWMEYLRTGKLLIVGVIFVLFGLMNPAMAKLTPYLMEQLAQSDNSGMIIEITTVDASMSWTQFYKNIPVALIVCLLVFGGILTNELHKGTLIPVLTKGLSRWKVVLTKAVNVIVIWSAGYWICYGITYFYNDYYWDNSVLGNIFFSAFSYWLFGLMIMALMLLMSALSSSMGMVIFGVGLCYFAMTILGLFPVAKKYLPTYLTSSQTILSGNDISEYAAAIIITAGITCISIVTACLIFNKREVN